MAKYPLDPCWLPKRRCVQLGEDLRDQGGVIAAAGPLQQRHHPTAGQLLPDCRGRRGRQHGQRCLVLRLGNACSACG